jgi:hypothetical protein
MNGTKRLPMVVTFDLADVSYKDIVESSVQILTLLF